MGEKHTIYFEPVDIEMEVDEDEKILDAAFRHGIHLMHGCREGQCSACKSYMLEGDVQMERYSTFACNDSEVEEGFVLLCRAHAFSDCTIELLNFDADELLNSFPIQNVKARIDAIESLTRDIVSLRLTATDPDKYAFKPGQYADITIPGTDQHRSFSMATTGATPDQIEFLIKKYPGGVFSGLLEDGLSVGDEIELEGPYGNFTLKSGHVLPVVMIAGGAGMAPVLSLLRHMNETEVARPVRFYYGARTPEDLFYLEEIARLGDGLADFTFVACLSETPPRPGELDGVACEIGNVTEIADRLEDSLRTCELYFCGPPPMVDAALELAASHGVPEDQVFYDKFTNPLQD